MAQANPNPATCEGGTVLRLIPTSINQNPWSHWRLPMDMIFHGWSMSLLQASQQSVTICS
jgi:hypothetical protein